MPNWNAVAQALLSSAHSSAKLNIPSAEVVLIVWQGQGYFGSIQVIFPEYDTEIVLLSKTSGAVRQELVQAIREIEPEIPVLTALDMLDLEGNHHVVRRFGDNLLEMTYEQTQYSAANMPAIQDQQGRAGFGAIVDYPHPISDANGCR